MNYSKSTLKLFKAALATTVATGAMVAVVPTNANAATDTFKDVKAGSFYYDSVLNLSARGIINGFSDGTFKPDQAVTRGQAAQIIALALDLDTKNVKNPGFTDVKVTDRFYGPIAALAAAGILNGNSDKTFKSGNPLSRGQMAIILTLAFELEKEALTDTRFTDVKKGDAYSSYIQALLTNKITSGMTPTTFAPNATVTRGQMATFIVKSEAAASVKEKIVNITDDSVELTTGTYKLPTELKTLFSTSNLAALKGAVVDLKIVNGAITNLKSIEINASGEATKNIVLDGQGSTFAGNLAVNSDYVTVKNITLKGNLEIRNNVKNSFRSENITVEGNTIISDKATSGVVLTATSDMLTNVASLNIPVNKGFSAVTPNTQIVFVNSTLNAVEARSNSVSIDAKGSTKVKEIVLSSNVLLKADAGVTIPKVTIQGGATAVTINANVLDLVVNSASKLALDGSGNIKALTVQGNGALNFNSTGKIDNLDIKSKDAVIALGANAKIGNIVLPAGVAAKDIIQDFDKVKANIEKIDGKTNPDFKPTAPGAGGGGGGGGSTGGGGTDVPGATGNDLLNQTLRDQIAAGNSAAGGAVTITLTGNTFNVKINTADSKMGDFSTAAGSIFDSVKSSIVINSGSVILGGVPITIDNINNNQNFADIIRKALKLVGYSESTKLSEIKGKSITFSVTGTINSKSFSDTYSFDFQ